MNTIDLPKSTRIKHQIKTKEFKYTVKGKPYRLVVNLRYDDQCGNGHNTFGITADLYAGPAVGRCEAGGCLHEEITKHAKEFALFIKWHGCTSEGPLHYVANTTYLAGTKDHWGLQKGEFRQHTSRGPTQNNGVEGVPNWTLSAPAHTERDVYSTTKPAPVLCEWEAHGRTGEGKEAQLAAARQAAIWPDASLEQLQSESALLERLPALIEEFKQAMESLGFTY